MVAILCNSESKFCFYDMESSVFWVSKLIAIFGIFVFMSGSSAFADSCEAQMKRLTWNQFVNWVTERNSAVEKPAAIYFLEGYQSGVTNRAQKKWMTMIVGRVAFMMVRDVKAEKLAGKDYVWKVSAFRVDTLMFNQIKFKAWRVSLDEKSRKPIEAFVEKLAPLDELLDVRNPLSYQVSNFYPFWDSGLGGSSDFLWIEEDFNPSSLDGWNEGSEKQVLQVYTDFDKLMSDVKNYSGAVLASGVMTGFSSAVGLSLLIHHYGGSESFIKSGFLFGLFGAGLTGAVLMSKARNWWIKKRVRSIEREAEARSKKRPMLAPY